MASWFATRLGTPDNRKSKLSVPSSASGGFSATPNPAHSGQRFLQRRAQILASAEEETGGRALACIEDHGGVVMVHLLCMTLDVSRRSPHALFLAGKQHEPDGAARLHPHLANPAGGVDRHYGVDPVVFRARAQIPESRCAPSSTISSGRSRPRISPITLRDSYGPPVWFARFRRTRTSPVSASRAKRVACSRDITATGMGTIPPLTSMGWR